MTGDFRKWAARLFQAKTAARAADRRPRRAPVFRVETLEDRVVPTITITDTPGGGSLDADLLADGIVNDDGTLSRGALTSVAAATPISVTAATGDITFPNFAATVTLLTGGGSSATFTAPGVISFADLTDVFATSGGGLVFVAGGSASLPALSGGSLDVTAGGATTVGSATTTGGIDITSTGGAVNSLGTLQTPGQLTLDAELGINVQSSAATLQANNGTVGDITVTQTAAPSQLLTITNTAGGVVNNAPGGAITITNLGSGIQLDPSAPVSTTGNGDITLAAQDFIIDATATINAGTGATTLANSDAGRLINLGGNGVTVGRLTLTQTELDRVTGTGILRVGSTTAGAFEVNAPINANTPVARAALTLLTGGDLTDVGTGAVTATNLRIGGNAAALDNPANAVTNLVTDLAGILFFNNGTDPLTVGAGIDGVTGVTASLNVTLIADDLNIANAVNAGTARALFAPSSDGRPVDLGTETGGSLSITDAELDRVTAGVIQVSPGGGNGMIVVTALINPANAPALSLTGNGSITDTATGSITVANLFVANTFTVILDNGANDVDTLAGTLTVGGTFTFADADGFVIGTADGNTGIAAAGTSTVTLIAGGAVTQAAGAAVLATALELLGAGPFTLSEVTNDVDVIAANVTNALTYTDADGLLVGTAGGSLGLTTVNAAITVTTVDGDLTIENSGAGTDIFAGTGTVTLTVGGAPGENRLLDLQNNGGAGIVGTGGVTLTADNMQIADTVDAGANTALVQPFEAGTQISLGGAGSPGVLGLNDGELDQFTAGVLQIGNAAAGNITTVAAVSPGGTSQLELVTGGGIVDGVGGLDVTVTRLGLTAGTGIGSAVELNVIVSNLEATTATGNIRIDNFTTALTVGGVNATLAGLDVTTSGDIVLRSNNTITVSEGVSAAGGGNVAITTSSNNIVVNAAVSATGGDGNVTLNAEDDVNLNAAVSAVGAGDVTIIAEPTLGNAGTITSVAAGTVTAETGDVRLEAMDNVNLAGAVAVTAGTGTITVIAERITGPSAAAGNFTSSGTGTLTTAGGAISIQAGDDITVGAAISAGGAGGVTILADAAIDTIGNVTSTAPISTVSGSISAVGVNVTLNAGGTVMSTAGGAITLRATSGNGGSATLSAAVSTAGGNGNVLIEADNNVVVNAAVSAAGTGNLTAVANFDAVGGGDFTSTAGGTLTTAAGAITVTASNITFGGDVTTGSAAISATASGGLFTNQADVSAGGGGMVTIRADRADLQAGSTVSTTDVVNIRVDSGGNTIDLGSAAAGPGMNLTDAELDTITAGNRLILSSSADVTVTDTITLDPARVATLLIEANLGAVTDGTAADVQDDLFVDNLAITAAAGVGSADTLNVAVTNLAISNTTSGNVLLSNRFFSAGGPLNITVVAGVAGVQNGSPGDTSISNAGGVMNVLEEVEGSGGGNAFLSTSGAGADIVVDDPNGRVAATGGNGNVTLDTTDATSGGQITINGTAGGVEVLATGTGNVTLDARAGVTIGASADVQSGNTAAGGDIGIRANVGVTGGGEDITLGANSFVNTRGNISLTTDPDFVFTGTAAADIVMAPTAIIKGNGNTVVDNKALTVVLRADGDVTVSNVWADTDLGITAAENILDDADPADATFIQATDIQLIAGGLIGGAVQIGPSDVISAGGTPTAPYRGAIDFDLDNLGSLTITTGAAVVLTGTGGNVQIRQVDDPLDPNPEPVRTSDLNVTNASINADNQLAVISSAGDFLVDSGFVVPSNADVLLATTGGFNVGITGGVTNPGGMNADTVIVASGSPTASIIGSPGGVADVVGPVVNLVTTGGTVGNNVALPLEINATRLDGNTAGGSAFITDTQNGVAVGLFNAGLGFVSLASLGNNGTTANITAVTHNDNVAEIVAGAVSLDTSAAGPVAGPNGQIGRPAQFFEVDTGFLSALTNDSSLWLSEVGSGASAGAVIGLVSTGGPVVGTAFLRVRNGGLLTGSSFDGVSDVTAGTVNLSTVAGDPGSFGTSITPLEIDATSLTANLAGGGSVFVNDLSNGLAVARATTAGGSIGILTVGGSITIGTGASPAVDTNVGGAPTDTVFLTAIGGSVTGPGGVGGTDVRALNLFLTASGVGTGTTPAGALQTAVTNLGFDNSAGVVNVVNTGALTIVGAAGTNTSSNTGTTTTITASSPMTFAVDTFSVGSATYTAGETSDAPAFADNLTVNAGVTVSVTGGNLTLQAGDDILLNGTSVVTASGTVTLNVGFSDLDGLGGAFIRGTVDSTAGTVLVNGGTGDDFVFVDYTGGAVLPDGLVFAGGGGGDALEASDAGGTAAHSYVVTPTGVTRDGAAALGFAADVEAVRVTGGNLADAFTVTAGANTQIDIQGGDPITAPGDTLTVTNSAAAFLTVTGTGSVSGTYDFPAGTADVTFSNIESLDTGADAVSVTKDDGATTAIPGNMVTYTVVVTNNATVGLSGIRVQDLVPAAITGVSFTAVFAGVGSAGNAGPTAGNSIDEVISLAAAGTATYTITGTLAPTTPAGTGTLANTVTVTPPAGVTDDAMNNSATDTNNVVPTGDVIVTKDNGTTTTVPGTSTFYTIVVSNTGPSTATVSFSDMFPAAITSATWSSLSAGGASGAPASGSGNIANTLTLPGGSSVTYTVNAAVNGAATGTLSNTATATILTPGFDQAGSLANDSATDTDTLTPTGDVVVTKTNGTTTVTAGTTTTYTITVTNSGPSTVTVPFADNLPAQITSATRTVINAGGASGGTAGAGNIADSLTVPAGGAVTYRVTAMIDPAAAAGTLTNTATATVPGTVIGNIPANDSATDSDVLVSAPDVGVSVNAPATGKVGTAFTYTFNVSNFGASVQTNVVLTHTLPVDAINASATSTQGTATIAGGVLTAAIGTLLPGAFATVTVTLTPTDDGLFVLVGTVAGAIPEGNTGNNSAGATTQVSAYQPLIVAGPGNGGGAEVRVLNADTGALEARFLPFGPFYNFAMSVAQGDINGDGVPEIIVGAGPGGAARVVVYDVRTGAELRSFFAFEPSVTGGVNVGAGDLDGDGKDEILTGAGAGFGPRVRAFSGATGAEIRSFFAYEPSFTGGVRVAVGDTNGDGRADIITGAGGGGSARVQVFDGTTLATLQNFFAYESGLREGVFVTAADTNGDGIAEIVAGAAGGGASRIRIFDGKTLAEKASFFAFAPTARDGVTVAKTDRNSDGIDDITAGTGVGVQAQVKEFDGSGKEEAVFNAFDLGFSNGVFVG